MHCARAVVYRPEAALTSSTTDYDGGPRRAVLALDVVGGSARVGPRAPYASSRPGMAEITNVQAAWRASARTALIARVPHRRRLASNRQIFIKRRAQIDQL